MIECWTWPTPNGHKVHIALEELGLPYKVIPINIGAGEQFEPEFLAITPNHRIPAIVDPDGPGGKPLTLFESGAILLYLADKSKSFIPQDLRGRTEVLQWLFWQVGGLGPMAGQNHHFTQYAPEPVPYAIERYVKETSRLYAVLDKQLADRTYVAGDYSIADMACYPWIVLHERQSQKLEDYPNLKRWFETIRERPGTQRAYARGKEINRSPTMTDDEKRILFGQDASRVRRPA